MLQGTHSLHRWTITKQANKAKSGFLFFQLAQPFFCLRAHVFRRSAAEAGPALHRTVNRKNVEHVVADSRLNFAHNSKRDPMQRNARLGRLGDDPSSNVVCLAEWYFQTP